MAFVNIGIHTRTLPRRKRIPPVQYRIVNKGRSCSITINSEILEKCKFKGEYCRVLFDDDSQIIAIETCKDPYEAGVYKWQIKKKSSTVASIEFVFPPANIVALPRNNYIVSEFAATTNRLHFKLKATDIVRAENDTPKPVEGDI